MIKDFLSKVIDDISNSPEEGRLELRYALISETKEKLVEYQKQFFFELKERGMNHRYNMKKGMMDFFNSECEIYFIEASYLNSYSLKTRKYDGIYFAGDYNRAFLIEYLKPALKKDGWII